LARVLIVACGCRGRSLARELGARGHAVRGTTREQRGVDEIELVGAEAYVGDPNRVGTLTPALESVTVVCLLLGSASGAADDIAALHSSRLEMLLHRIIDTPVRGLAYEAVGTVEEDILRRGVDIVHAVCARSRIPYVRLDAEPRDHAGWLGAAAAAVEDLLSGRGSRSPGGPADPKVSGNPGAAANRGDPLPPLR
jgi:hypothetical protein